MYTAHPQVRSLCLCLCLCLSDTQSHYYTYTFACVLSSTSTIGGHGPESGGESVIHNQAERRLLISTVLPINAEEDLDFTNFSHTVEGPDVNIIKDGELRSFVVEMLSNESKITFPTSSENRSLVLQFRHQGKFLSFTLIVMDSNRCLYIHMVMHTYAHSYVHTYIHTYIQCI